MLSSSPRDQLHERQEEVEKLERAVKRTESVVNKDRLDAIQRDAVARAAKEEKDKRKEGKGEWHMKKCKLYLEQNDTIPLIHMRVCS